MKPALILIDLQHDFLHREPLAEPPDELVGRARTLLTRCRELGVPVLHVHTEVRADGANTMPHWRESGTLLCVADTPGVQPPVGLEPTRGEPRFAKQFFSAFGSPQLDAALRELGVEVVVLAGLYLHGCVRATALDAYERGYRVWIADDAVGSGDPHHAEVTRIYLEGRAASFHDTATLLTKLGGSGRSPSPSAGERMVPAALVGGERVAGAWDTCVVRRNPSDWAEVIARIPAAAADAVDRACLGAVEAQRLWQRVAPHDRSAQLLAWAEVLEQRAGALAERLSMEVGKPITDGRAEVRAAIEHVRTTARLFGEEQTLAIAERPAVDVRHRPQGIVGLVTPWNNPVSIPVAKIAAAVAFGNGAVWKPAIHAPLTAMEVMESFAAAGLPAGLVNLVFGESRTVRTLIAHPSLAALSFTGSIGAGRNVAACCSRRGLPLQAELGGNNAAIVLADCDVSAEARALALSAFSFCGQRCTAIQRFVVERSIAADLESALVEAVLSLRVGPPGEDATEVGPLVSRGRRDGIVTQIAGAVRSGARLCCGGTEPDGLEAGCWLQPAVLSDVSPAAPVATQEVFGPLAIILPADDIDHAIDLANGVEHGLLTALHTSSQSSRRLFAERAEAGILKVTPGPLAVHAEAPFGGWKASGQGPPEHGAWDRAFYTRPQALYGWPALEPRP